MPNPQRNTNQEQLPDWLKRYYQRLKQAKPNFAVAIIKLNHKLATQQTENQRFFYFKNERCSTKAITSSLLPRTHWTLTFTYIPHNTKQEEEQNAKEYHIGISFSYDPNLPAIVYCWQNSHHKHYYQLSLLDIVEELRRKSDPATLANFIVGLLPKYTNKLFKEKTHEKSETDYDPDQTLSEIANTYIPANDTWDYT